MFPINKSRSMATEEHKRLAAVIKECHKLLRDQSKIYGAEQAWRSHLQNEPLLQEYADAMYQLAGIWEKNSDKESLARSRVQWVAQFCADYFYGERIYLCNREREQRLLSAWAPELGDRIHCSYLQSLSDSVRMLDVGSCFNPFAAYPHLAVTAIDICPATTDVLRGDFLQIPVDARQKTPKLKDTRDVLSLPGEAYECVIFSLLLEYIPSAQQRLECCRKAYALLMYEGVLIIITPDSQHVGKNAALMKNWRYTLGTLGFLRVRFEKLPHITCMAFRKATAPSIAQHWAATHRKPYMTETIEIPQDNND